jgi:hypothetical protein
MDEATEARAKQGVRPDAIGWKAIAEALGVSRAQAQRWQAHGLPVINYGPTQVAGYVDRLLAWATSCRPRRAA